MNAVSNNATAPEAAIAPGAESIDARRAAERLAARFEGGMDPRVREIVPGFDAPFFQAGLAGYSDAAMRIVARRHGCPFCVTEALLDRTLLAGGRGFAKADLGELADNVPGGADDHPLACQIMGSEPREMAAAALKAAEQGRRGDKAYRMMAYAGLSAEEREEVESVHLRLPGGGQVGRVRVGEEDETCETTIDEADALVWIGESEERKAKSEIGNENGAAGLAADASFEVIDVNLACPVKKVKSKARGGHWLAEPEGAIRILEAVREVVPREIPCTVKLRRSFDDTAEMAANFERIFDAAFSMGYAWATVHARTVEQKYVGPSRWDVLREIMRRHPDKLVFGSGDIWGADDIFRLIEYTGVAGVSVARGCIGNPWIFRQARAMIAGEPARPPTIDEQREVLEEHYRLCVRVNGARLSGRLMRKFGIRFAVHHPRGEEVRRRFIAVESTEDWMRVLEEFYQRPPSRH